MISKALPEEGIEEVSFALYITLSSCPSPILLAALLVSSSFLSSSFLFFCYLYLFFGALPVWIRDLVRESGKKCTLLPLGVLLFGFALFVLSEAILFVSIFWASFHFSSSPFFGFQDLNFIPDPCELTYGNTLLLSNAAISLGSGEFNFFSSPHSISFLLAWMFLSLQIKEFRNLGFYLNDSVYGCVFFFLSGLHFLHVVVGLVILTIFSYHPSFLLEDGGQRFYTSQDLYFIFQVLYWHFVEVVWLFIFLLFYSL